MTSRCYVKLQDWQEVRGCADRGAPLYYHAPLDRGPALVVPVKLYKNGKLRLVANGVRFTADSGHLDRFRKLVTVELGEPSPSAASYTHPADSIAHQDD